MEFPIEIQRLINEYAKPCTRLDWRKGCYFNHMIIHFNQLSRCTNRYTFKRCIEAMYNIKHGVDFISFHVYYEHYDNIQLDDYI